MLLHLVAEPGPVEAQVVLSRQGFEQLRSEMKAEFATLRGEIDHSLHGVERKIDALNHNILQVQADHRYNDRRLQEIEDQVKQT